jgi:hypothetical protein
MATVLTLRQPYIKMVMVSRDSAGRTRQRRIDLEGDTAELFALIQWVIAWVLRSVFVLHPVLIAYKVSVGAWLVLPESARAHIVALPVTLWGPGWGRDLRMIWREVTGRG